MNIILGASGQVGSAIVQELIHRDSPVRAVVRNPDSMAGSKAEIRKADLFNLPQLKDALREGTTVFLFTPEDPSSHDITGETKQVIANYREAIRDSGIKRIIGLSCIGAHIEGNTGNILLSRMLEHGFSDLDIDQVFIRPSYYFSNWLGFMEPVEQYGMLPSFFPENLKIDMISPIDLAKFIAKLITNNDQPEEKKIYEVVGPEKYSPRQVAEAISKVLQKEITLQPVPRKKWKETLLSAGFTENTSDGLMNMTQAVVDNIAVPENGTDKLPTTLDRYLKERLRT